MERKLSEMANSVNRRSGVATVPRLQFHLRNGINSESPRGAELGLHTGTVLEAIRMQVIGRALLASVFVLGACAGGDKSSTKTDSTAMTSTTTTTTAAPAATDRPWAARQWPACVRLLVPLPQPARCACCWCRCRRAGNRQDGRREDDRRRKGLSLRSREHHGQGWRCDQVHERQRVARTTSASIPRRFRRAVQPQLGANMPGDHSMGALEGPLLLQPNETYVISFAKIPAGTYDYSLHAAPRARHEGRDHGSVVAARATDDSVRRDILGAKMLRHRRPLCHHPRVAECRQPS